MTEARGDCFHVLTGEPVLPRIDERLQKRRHFFRVFWSSRSLLHEASRPSLDQFLRAAKVVVAMAMTTTSNVYTTSFGCKLLIRACKALVST